MSSPRVVFGARPVQEVLRARPQEVQALYVAAGRRREAWLDAALAALPVESEHREARSLDRLARGGTHQGLVAIVGAYPYLAFEDLLERAVRAPDAALVVLDQVQDPGNLGAIIRSAYALGAVGVVLPERRAAAVTATVVKTSAGATEHLPIARVTNLARALAAIREAGHWLVGAVGAAGKPPETLDLVDRAVLVLGSEGQGLRRTTREKCDFLVTVPMAGGLDSLNVSVTAGILLAEAARQRRLTRSSSGS
ncbi:MAG: 23S rRNA (guanosine(2251)-2'-O)-methyltransferase RlmB [bacterium]